MEIDARICSQARLSRDARFDGRFFIGVRSTHIYCRPICPVRAVKEENVLYFPTAAAAAEAGYRPCLRCRPELSPGTPAWLGTSNTVSRALRLISEKALDDRSLDELASRLGVGSRQLRRLFLRHLGATPLAVAKTSRLHFAKKLIDETHLAMGEIALAAGYGSVRRFNAAFRETYKRTPTELRRRAHISAAQPDQYLFRLHFRPPFHWQSLLDFLGQRAIAGVEAVELGAYRRTIAVNGDSGTLSVALSPNGDDALEVSISFPEPRWLFLIVERIRRMFDLSADPTEIASHLRNDALLAGRIQAIPGMRVPGCWDGFELAVRAVLGQQVSVAAASTLAGRLARTFGKEISAAGRLTHLFPPADALAQADLARIGVTKARAETIRALSRSVIAGRINFDSVTSFDEFRLRLCALPGIGDWTAQYIAMRALGDPDAFPGGDLHLLRNSSLGSKQELTQRAEHWRPWRAYGVMYLWQADETAV